MADVKNIENIYKLTPLQEGMLFHQMLNETHTEYVLQTIFNSKNINADVLRDTLDLLSEKHEVLRTIFVVRKVKAPVQIILRKRQIELSIVDLSGDLNIQDTLEKLKASDIVRGFDLEKDSLLRITLVKMGCEGCRLIWSMHHIIVDGWSNSIIFSDFMNIYEAIMNGADRKRLEEEILRGKQGKASYGDYLKLVAEKNKREGLAYWRDLLSDYEEIAQFNPCGTLQKHEKSVLTAELVFCEADNNKLVEAVRQYGVTVSTIVEAAYGILLQRYNYCTDVVFGKVVSGRDPELDGIESMVGLFINTVPVRVKNEPDTTLRQLIVNMLNQSLESGKHDYCGLAEIQSYASLPRDFVKVLYAFENYYVDEQNISKMSGSDFTFEYAREETNYDMNLAAYQQEGLHLKLMYNPSRYEIDFIQRILEQLRLIIQEIVNNPEIKVKDLEIITEKEKVHILKDFNNTYGEYPSEKTIVQLFEEQVKRYGDRDAIEYDGELLSYRELNEKANRIAWKLKEAGIGREDIVAVMAVRNAATMAGILGVLKAGGAYVPIDPDNPEERLLCILEDCAPKAIVYQGHSIEYKKEIPMIDLADCEVREGAAVNPENVNLPEDLAYIIYTSGTTGRPKGVMIEHLGVANLREYFQKELKVKPDDRALQFANLAFDASISEICMSLLSGACMMMATEEIKKDIKKFRSYIENGVTTAILPPQYYALSGIKGLRSIVTAGSESSREIVEDGIRNHRKYSNDYGPTEVTVCAAHWECEAGMAIPDRIPIGKPILNKQIYIMNGNSLCGIGVPGELCIAGTGLARGYLNRPELTEEKFVRNPYGEGRLYRTGDLARWLPDGNIEFLGRIDEQVKLRGFRIELGEIEAVIRKEAEIKDCTVIIRKDMAGEPEIYAYLVSDEEINLEKIRRNIARSLAPYMLPACMTQIDTIPLNRNGKIDKKALPEIAGRISGEYTAPVNETEAIICRIFCEILQIKQAGATDSFFELGGHSLRAMRMINRIEEETGVRIALKEVFKASTPRQLAELAETRRNAGRGYEPIPAAEEKEYYPMSSAQKRTYLLWQMDREGTSYNMPMAIRLTGEVRPEGIRAALKEMINRHEILRTRFLTVNGEPVQKILKETEADPDFTVFGGPITEGTVTEGTVTEDTVTEGTATEDTVTEGTVTEGTVTEDTVTEDTVTEDTVTEDTATEDTAAEEKELVKSFIRPFDLEKAQLLRAALVRRQEGYLLMLDMHHIVSDGMSAGIFFREFAAIYNGEGLTTAARQYKDYSEWMRSRDLTAQKDYWVSLFRDEIPVLDLPLDFHRPQEQSFKGGEVYRSTGRELGDRIRAAAKKAGATEYMVLLSAAMVLLGKYSRQEDIVIGSPVSGRTHKDTEGMLGMFVNTLAMRGKPEGGRTYADFLKEIRESCLKAYENQEYPFEELVEAVEVRRDISRNPLFDVMLVLQNNEREEIKLNGADTRMTGQEHTIAKFDLTFNLWEKEGEYLIMLEYCSDLFKEESAQRMLDHYHVVLQQVTEQEEILLRDIETATAEEKDLILGSFNGTKAEYQKDRTMAELFEEQAERYGDRDAIEYDGELLSYRELNEKANRIAWKLKEAGIGREDIVAVMAVRNAATMAGILGVLKAGGAYVPIDPDNPEERLLCILEDCAPKAIVYQGHSIEYKKEIPMIDLADCEVREGAAVNPENVNLPEDLAYIIYTSGTTGRPKGVMIEHLGVANLREYFQKELKVKPDDRALQFANLAFDASISEICMSLLSGACMMMATEEIKKDIKKFRSYIENGVTTAILPPQYYALSGIKGLRSIVTAGSESSREIVEDGIRNHRKYSNDYGPTEVTVCAAHWECEAGMAIPDRIPIGKPILNKQIYIMNGNSLCGIGVPGELCIAGTGLARGYLNRPELTEEKFVRNPYGEGRLYRTGDLARWLPDGNIEFLGRIDEQVKLRGFRIELGEIEAVIRKEAEIKDCTVIIRKDMAGEPEIYAYLVSDEEINLEKIRRNIARSLAPYMLPACMTQIDTIPLNRNGKIDKKALPEIAGRISGEYTAPVNETEAIICRIFCEILQIKQAGATDSFFELGGHSLRAMRMINRIEEETGVRIALKEVFKASTPRQLAELAETRRNAGRGYEPIPAAEEKEYYPMSSAQKRMYLIYQSNRDSLAYNTFLAVELPEEADDDRLEEAFWKLIDRHEILHTRFLEKEGMPVQEIWKDYRFKMERQERTSLSGDLSEGFVRPFCLEEELPTRAMLISSPGRKVLLLDLHHIVQDAATLNLLAEEYIRFYRGWEPAPLRLQYKDYSEWMLKRDLSSQKQYWLKVFDEKAPRLEMASDHARPAVKSFEGELIGCRLDREVREMVEELSAFTGATTYMVLLSAWMLLLSRYSGQEDIVAGSPASGRTHKDTERMSGMFVNTMAVRGRPCRDKTFLQFLEEMKEAGISALENQEYPFEELVEELGIARDASRNPLFDVMFILQNTDVNLESLQSTASVRPEQRRGGSKFDLTLEIYEAADGYAASLEYSTDLFTKGSAEWILRHYEKLVRECCAHAKEAMGLINMTTEEEMAEIRIYAKRDKRKGIRILNDGMECGIGINGRIYEETPEGRWQDSKIAGRWQADGTLKEEGYVEERLEWEGKVLNPGSIEKVLEETSEVASSAVALRTDEKGTEILCAYIKLQAGGSLTSVRHHAELCLPADRRPGVYVEVEEVPLSPDGRKDRELLTQVMLTLQPEKRKEAGNAAEEEILGLMRSILRKENLGVCESFFEAGGNSLLGIRLVSAMRKSGYSIKIGDLFRHETAENLARFVTCSYSEKAAEEAYEAIPAAGEKEYYPMSSTQKRTYLLWQMDREGTSYNMPMAIRLTGEVRPEGIRAALKEMIIRHEILRTRFLTVNGELVQKILPEAEAEPDFTVVGEPDIEGTDIEDTVIEDIDIEGADIEDTVIEDIDIEGADIEGADIEDTDIEDTDIEGTDIEDIVIEGADIEDTVIEDIVIEGTDIEGIVIEDIVTEDTVTKDTVTEEKKLVRSFVRPFDLEKAQLLRAALVRRQEGYLLMLDMHHIVSDGMSAGIFFREFAAIYNGEGLTTAARQYKDYSEWMRSRDLTAQKDYWVSLFRDEIPVLDLPLDFHRPQEQSFKGGEVYRSTGRELGDRIRAAAKKAGATEYMVLLSAAMVLLGKYSRQEDIVIGSPVSGRTHKDTEGMLGMFVNTLAMRGKPEGGRTYADFLKEIRESCLKAYENQEYPFEELVEAVEVRRDISRNPLFDVMLVLQNNEREEIKLSGADTRMTLQEHMIAKFDLTFNIWEKEGEYLTALEYCSDLFREESVQRMLDHYHTVLKQVTEQEEILLRDIETATAEEKGLILGSFNDTKAGYPKDKTVAEIVEEQVKKTPDRTALVFGEEKCTYRELNEKANILANRLRTLGVGPDDFVAILAERSLEMIQGIYGIIKAGGAYVPVDPSYPEERIRFMLEDCAPKAVLVYHAKMTVTGPEIPVIDLAESGAWEGVTEDPEPVNSPEDIVYCIYTSGTTGRPKGVMNRHTGLINRLSWMQGRYPITEKDVIMQKTTFTFDVSVWEIVWWALAGAKVVLLRPGDEKDANEICRAIEKHGVTTIHFVPTMLKRFLEHVHADRRGTDLTSLRYVFASGEALKPEHWTDFNELRREGLLKADLINLYGPTEASIDVTYFDCYEGCGIIPIGRPIANTQIYIMDGNSLCGIGVPGELCIAGTGLARGYLNRPELNVKKFVRNPYGEGKLYHTGDLARWLPDGNIEYLGRIDEQVKIRGFRIEPGEIEAVIRKEAGIRDCAVIARKDTAGDPAIYAYLVSDEAIDLAAIRKNIGRSLTSYMIPSYMMQIEKLPATKNGKLDKRALPEISGKSGREYAAPENETEAVICRIFGEILGVEKVGITDDFFELGGHSISVVRLEMSLENEGYHVEIAQIFENMTPKQLAYSINNGT